MIVQSVAQLSDRYERKGWEELVGNCDLQLFLGGNDEMTAEYISHKCGMVTIGLTNNQMPMPPLFSPILNSTKPYSQTRSNAQRALMLPDEVLRLSNDKCIVLLRGQKPLLLKKIIPDELPMFRELSPVRITDYVPQWRRKEEEREKQKKARKTADTAGSAGSAQEKSEQQKAAGKSRTTQSQAAASATESPQKRKNQINPTHRQVHIGCRRRSKAVRRTTALCLNRRKRRNVNRKATRLLPMAGCSALLWLMMIRPCSWWRSVRRRSCGRGCDEEEKK